MTISQFLKMKNWGIGKCVMRSIHRSLSIWMIFPNCAQRDTSSKLFVQFALNLLISLFWLMENCQIAPTNNLFQVNDKNWWKSCCLLITGDTSSIQSLWRVLIITHIEQNCPISWETSINWSNFGILLKQHLVFV